MKQIILKRHKENKTKSTMMVNSPSPCFKLKVKPHQVAFDSHLYIIKKLKPNIL